MRIGHPLADRFVLERLAGRGGMGEVYRALDRSTGQPVAVKVLHGQQDSNVARFEREARLLSELDHPRVVRHVAHGALASGERYVVMEWLEGEDLAARLARERLSVADSITLATSVAEALDALHGRGVVHRDLKPSNIFLVDGRIARVKLLDFGVARIEAFTRMTATGTLLGTVAYMAPEQARGEPSVDARADVFSLGCVLFECLTGERAFGGEDMVAILTKVLFEETPSARRLSPEVPEALEALVQRMLAKERDDRPRDSRAVAAALGALGEPPSAAPGGWARAPALTSNEQRAMAVILISAPAEEEAPLPSASAPTVELQGDNGTLLREAARHGSIGERLLDGSVAVVMASLGLATDLCAQAARCALSLRALAGGRRIALAMGRGERTGRPLGPAIDRAARLSGTQARPFPAEEAVLIDEVVAGLLDARFEVREEEGFFTLHGERALGEGTRLLLGKATPCVGRERELDTLRALLAESVEERTAQAVLMTAPPGAGKSRLAQEFVRELRARDEAVSIWIARGDPLRKGSPLGMLGQALRSACGIREGEPLLVRRDKLSAQVSAWVAPGEQGRVAAFLGELVGAPFPDEDSLPLRAARRDAQLMADQVRAAFLDFLAAACAYQPVLVLLEDLHWGDQSTVQLLDAALREHEGQPLFILILARPEVREVFPRLWEGWRLHQLRLNELHRRAGERLARHVLGPGADAETIARLVRLSEGNAFYLEELIRWTAEGKGPDVPATVVAMVQSHLGVLADEDRRILRAASIFGETFWAGGVAALLGDAGARAAGVVEQLGALARQELLLERKDSRLPEEREFAFRHALVREGAYAMLTDEDRALGHRLAGAWLEAQCEIDAVLLAEHFEKGGNQERAGHHYLRAAKQAYAAGDSTAAVACTRRGLACSVPDELRLALLGALCEIIVWQFESVGSALSHAEELVRSTPRGSAPWTQGMFVVMFCELQAGRLDGFMASLGALRSVELSIDAAATAILALFSGVYLLDFLGQMREAEAVLGRIAALVHTFGDREPFATTLWHLLRATRNAYTEEDPWSAREHGEAALSIVRSIEHRRYEGVAQLLMGMNGWLLGAYDEAERLFRGVAIPDEEMGLGSSVRPFAFAWLLADRGALAEARQRATDLVTAGQSRRLPIDEGRGHWALAEVLRRAGELAAAEAAIQAALAVFGAACPLDAPGALATLAALRLAQGRAAEALAAAEEGLVKYESIGACSHFFRGAFLRLIHAECLEATGIHEAAKAAIAKARDRLLEIADKIGDPGYKKSFLDNVPENRRTLELARQWLGE